MLGQEEPVSGHKDCGMSRWWWMIPPRNETALKLKSMRICKRKDLRLNNSSSMGDTNKQIIEWLNFIFAKFCIKLVTFSSFIQLFCSKCTEKAYFNQHLDCAAPKHWLKYTTLLFWNKPSVRNPSDQSLAYNFFQIKHFLLLNQLENFEVFLIIW